VPQINLRFFGFGSRASGIDTEAKNVRQGTTARELWEALRSSAGEQELLARIDEKNVSFFVNGRLVHHGKMHESVLEEGDTVTFMVLAMGGQSWSSERR
jgi:molybdopterin converting factor small subunit